LGRLARAHEPAGQGEHSPLGLLRPARQEHGQTVAEQREDDRQRRQADRRLVAGRVLRRDALHARRRVRSPAMTAVGELELPAFDSVDPTLSGARFHATMRELATQSWLASMPLGFVVLEREAGEFFLRSRSFTFPGLKIAEIFGIDDGPLWEEIRRNIL